MVTGVKLLMNLKMKKIYSYMVAAVATIAAISCTQELDTQRVSDTSFFTAFAEGAETKTVKNGKQSLWSEGDQIWVLNGQKGDDNDYSWKKSYTTSSDATSEAVFDEDQEYEMTGSTFFAVYPASAATNATWEGQGKDVKHVELKKVQTAIVGSFDPEAHIAVAQTTDNTLSFKNAVSLLKFQVKTPGVKTVTISSNNDETRELLAGLCSISASGDVTGWTNKIDENTFEAENWVELSAGEGEFEVEKDYYIAVFPVTLAKGFTVEFSYGGSKQKVKSHNGKLELLRNGVLNLGTIEHDSHHAWAVAGTFNNWNVFATPMTLEGDFYVARGVTGLAYGTPDAGKTESTTGIKFVENGETWRGGEGKAVAGVWSYVWGDGSNIYIEGADSATEYDIYLNLDEGDYGKFVIVPAGETMPEDNFNVEYWAVAGEFNGWNITDDKMTLVDDWYVLENISIAAGGQFKMCADGSWDINRGAEGEADGVVVENDVVTKAVSGGMNFAVSESGSYDLYINKTATKIKVVKVGDYVDPTPDPEPDPTPDPEPEPEPEPEISLYLKPNQNWKSKSGRYVAYCWIKDGVSEWKEAKAENNGIIEFSIPDKYPNVIFCCLKSDTQNDFNNKYYQTKDLTVTADKCYVVHANQQDKPEGDWFDVSEAGKILYLSTGNSWYQGNERFAAYFFNNSTGKNEWVDMKTVVTKLYYVVAKDYPNIIFCRMNKSATANNWNNKWDQTDDLTIPSNNNTYTITSSSNGKGKGSWSLK